MACACFTRNCPKFLQCQGCSRSILSGMCPVRTIITGPPPPWFCVSVASKELRVCVSGLESTLAGIPISVASKGVRGGVISHRSEDRPLHGEPELVRVAGRVGGTHARKEKRGPSTAQPNHLTGSEMGRKSWVASVGMTVRWWRSILPARQAAKALRTTGHAWRHRRKDPASETEAGAPRKEGKHAPQFDSGAKVTFLFRAHLFRRLSKYNNEKK